MAVVNKLQSPVVHLNATVRDFLNSLLKEDSGQRNFSRVEIDRGRVGPLEIVALFINWNLIYVGLRHIPSNKEHNQDLDASCEARTVDKQIREFEWFAHFFDLFI